MSRTQRKITHIEGLFKPDKETGISEWITREEIISYDGKLMTSNGNFRHGKCWIDKYNWEIKRLNDKPNNKVIEIRMNGFSNNKNKLKARPIRKDIRNNLLEKYKGCIHCGIHKRLCIDHKNDMYNNEEVLNKDTQKKEHFQVLCNKCNKDLKHQVNVEEKKTKKLHKVKELNISPFIQDYFNYPWEVGLTEYNEEHIHCKMYSYWYDIEGFHAKRDWFVKLRYVNKEVKRSTKLVE